MDRLLDNSRKYAITDDGRNLTVMNVTAKDEGRYICDSLGSKETRRRFIVTVQSRVTSKAVSAFLFTVMVVALCRALSMQLMHCMHQLAYESVS